MKTITAIIREILSLFIDDGSLALALLLWCAAVGLVAPRLGLAEKFDAPLLAAGCILVLVVNVLGSARRR